MIDEGYDTRSWEGLTTFSNRCATPEDVDSGAAVFAISETIGGRPLPMPLPQPVIWWAEEGEIAGVAVQAEAHQTEDAGHVDEGDHECGVMELDAPLVRRRGKSVEKELGAGHQRGERTQKRHEGQRPGEPRQVREV